LVIFTVTLLRKRLQEAEYTFSTIESVDYSPSGSWTDLSLRIAAGLKRPLAPARLSSGRPRRYSFPTRQGEEVLGLDSSSRSRSGTNEEFGRPPNSYSRPPARQSLERRHSIHEVSFGGVVQSWADVGRRVP
jgi:hypothetical protein